jgi:hypothetical protein
MRVFVEGIGLLGPGLNGWSEGRSVLRGGKPYVSAPTQLMASPLLPAAERRRTGAPVKLALAAGHEAFTNAGRDAATTATVFSSSGGDGENVHQVCQSLTSPEREVSPTRFHNSVHNAPAGYWSIATRSREPSTSLCCGDASFAAGLLEAATQVSVDGQATALVAYDLPYPEPLDAVHPVVAAFGVALVLTPASSTRTFATLDVSLVRGATTPTAMSEPALEALRAGVPAARSLPLLAILAQGASNVVILEYIAGSHLHITAAPCN